MKTYKQFLLEVTRSPERATNLLGYLHKKRVPENTKPHEREQMLNLIPHASERPVVQIDWERLEAGKYPTENIPTKSLTSGQHTVSSTVVAKKLHGQWKEHYPEIPVVIRHTDRTGKKTHVLVDGNHRGNAALVKGDPTIRCQVIEAGPETPMTPYRPRPSASKNPSIPKSKMVSRFVNALKGK